MAADLRSGTWIARMRIVGRRAGRRETGRRAAWVMCPGTLPPSHLGHISAGTDAECVKRVVGM
jgi:hypothetical protein